MTTTTMQGPPFAFLPLIIVELTYQAAPTLTMTCIARVKSAEVTKEVDEESGIEFGEVDLRVCLQAILLARYMSRETG
jgi:hypothetical protein